MSDEYHRAMEEQALRITSAKLKCLSNQFDAVAHTDELDGLYRLRDLVHQGNANAIELLLECYNGNNLSDLGREYLEQNAVFRKILIEDLDAQAARTRNPSPDGFNIGDSAQARRNSELVYPAPYAQAARTPFKPDCMRC